MYDYCDVHNINFLIRALHKYSVMHDCIMPDAIYCLYIYIHGSMTMCTLDFLGPRGTPHQCLSVGTDQVNNLPDLWLKSHVKHTVSLI